MIDHSHTNGKPRLLDGQGRPLRDGDARPADGLALPHSFQFVARQGGAENTYWHQMFDEAVRHSRESAAVMRNDCYLMALVDERRRAVSVLPWQLDIPDERDPRQRQVRDGLTRIIAGIPDIDRIIWWLTDAAWYGRYAVQLQWEWCGFRDYPPAGRPPAPPRRRQRPKRYAKDDPLASLLGGGGPPMAPPPAPKKPKPKSYAARGLTVAQAWPVNGDKIGHRYDHTPYVLVNAAEADRLGRANIVSTTQGRALVLDGTWRERFLVHRHQMEDADFFDPERAEAVHGLGLRSKLFWLDWLKREWLSNVTSFFDRVGLGVTVWKYPSGNAEALASVKKAAAEQSSRAHIFVPVEEGSTNTGVERVEVPTSGADALLKLVDYVDRALERYVVGQEASSRGTSSGMGNEAGAAFQMQTKSAITLQDAKMLAATLTGSAREPGLVNIIQRCTYPWADFPVRWKFSVEKPESDRKLQAARAMIELGLKVRADDIRSAAGLSKPARGDEVIEPPKQPGAGMPGAPGMPPPAGAPGMAPGAPPAGAAPPPPPEGGSMLDALRMAKLESRLRAMGRGGMADEIALRYARRRGDADAA